MMKRVGGLLRVRNMSPSMSNSPLLGGLRLTYPMTEGSQVARNRGILDGISDCTGDACEPSRGVSDTCVCMDDGVSGCQGGVSVCNMCVIS